MARVLVLANSRKTAGRCVAGVDLDSGEWVRPVSQRPNGELDIDECSVILSDGSTTEARAGDIVDMPLGARRASKWHPEDLLLAGPMRRLQHWSSQEITANLASLVDYGKSLLGSDGDRLSVAEIGARPKHSSLQLVRVVSPKFFWTTSMSGHAQLRGMLSIRGRWTDLSVTDVAAEASFRGRREPVTMDEALLTISLSTPFAPRGATEQYCFKLIAAVIPL